MSSDVIASVAMQVKTSDAAKQIDAFEERLGGLKQTAAGVGAAVAGMFVGSKMAAFGADLLRSASDAQETFGLFRAVFRNVVGEAQNGVAELRRSFQYSESAAQASMSALADIFSKNGADIRDALNYSEDINKVASDLAAFKNVDVEQATRALTNAMLGMGMSAQHLGVVVQDDAVKMKMAEEAADGLKFKTDLLAKLHARYSVILDQTANSQGQVARESTNYANRLKDLAAKVDDLKGEFGAAFIDPATKIVGVLSNAANRVEKWGSGTKKAIAFVGVGVPILVSFGVATFDVVAALGNYTNIAAIAAVATGKANKKSLESVAAEDARTVAVDYRTAATNAETAATEAEAAATREANRLASLASEEKRLETLATNAHTKELLAENEALRANARLKNAKLAGVGKDEFDDVKKAAQYRDERLNVARSTTADWTKKAANVTTLKDDAALRSVAARTAANDARKVATVATSKTKGLSGALNFAGTIPGVKQSSSTFKSLGNWFAKLIPVGGKLGFVLKGLTRFAGPIATVIGALEALKHGPALLEKLLNEWLPKLQEASGNALKWAWTVGLPAVGKWLGDLVVGAVVGLAQLTKRVGGLLMKTVLRALFGDWGAKFADKYFPAETGASRAYKLEKQLAAQREATAAATKAAADAEAARKAAAANSNATKAAYEATGTKIVDATRSKEDQEYLAKSEEAKTAVDELKAKIVAIDDAAATFDARKAAALGGAKTDEERKQVETTFAEERQKIVSGANVLERAKTTGDWQTARVSAAQLSGDYAQKSTLQDLQKSFESALEAAKTDADKAAVAADYAEKIGDLKRADAETSALVAEKNAQADRSTQMAANARTDFQRNGFLARANESRTSAAELYAGTFTGENLTALNDLSKSIQEAAKSATESIAEQTNARSEFDFQTRFDAIDENDKSGRISATRSRADELEKSLATIDDPAKKLDVERTIYGLRKDASDAEKALNDERKKTEEKRLGLIDELRLGEMRTPAEKWNLYSSQYARANESFDSAKTDDERFAAVEKMKSARDSAEQIAKDAREKAKKNSAPVDAQSAITRGSAEAFKLENRLRNVYQNKMLAATSATNAALANIYRRLQSMSSTSATQKLEELKLVVEG